MIVGMLLALFLASGGAEKPAAVPGGAKGTLARVADSNDYDGTLEFGGMTRTFLLHTSAPLNAATPGGPRRPMVLVLHGGGGGARGTAKMTGFNEKADREGFIAVYPSGTGRLFKDRLLTWNSGNCCGYAKEQNMDDVGFIRALIEHLTANYAVDPARVYVTGISNGGMMAYRLACEIPDRIAGIAPVAGALNVENCTPSRSVSVVAFHGTADLHVLYDGGVPKRRADPQPRTDRSVAHAISLWVKQDGCSPTPKHEEKGTIVKDTYTGCKNGTAVVLYTIKGQGHAWPGGQKWAAWADEPSHDLSATDAMWDFFKSHPKK